jgi:nitrogen fixation NifU-like protein
MLSDSERSMLLEQLARTPHSQLETFTHEGFARTPSCGDEITVRVTVEGLEIQELGWVGHGCTVSMAAAAALSGRAPIAIPEFPRLLAAYTASVNGGRGPDGEDGDGGDLEAFAGIGRFPLRAQCATLAWRALENALAERD